MVEIPSASLADIVFLLLIFFLLTTAIDTEKGVDIVLPPWGGEEMPVPRNNICNLLVNAGGQVLLDGEVVEISDISRIVREKIFANDKLIVSLKTDEDTKFDTYVQVLDELKKADAKRISLAEPEQD